jgi:acyl-CoA synthetase (AMP-forming)/AMP-acid ligase II
MIRAIEEGTRMSFPELNFEASTLVDVLRWRADNQSEALAYAFLEDGETASLSYTYKDLDARARGVAALLESAGVGRGERVLLLHPPGLEFVAAFYGCLYAGVVAIPAYPPGFNRNVRRIPGIVEDAEAKVALTVRPILDQLKQMFEVVPQLRTLRWVATDEVDAAAADDWREVSLNADDVCFLQYTSGSTALPRGVMISHRNLISNLHCCYVGWGHTPEDIALTWMPHYHDLGLVEGLLSPLYGGFPVYLMPPAAMVQRPLRWMQAVSRYRVTHSGGPNFTYDLCVRKTTPEQRAELDLSSWSVAVNGAEPVRRKTLERFAEAFAVSGFRWTSTHPCYGLAEATCVVTSGDRGSTPVFCDLKADALEQNRVAEAEAGETNVRSVVGVGKAVPTAQVVIVNAESLKRCRADEVGEIWIAGPSIAQGYWNKPESSGKTFRAHLADTGEGPFLRTGDLGFLKDGELFITGRLKDLIIIDGRNHYPQDIEQTVEQSHPGLRHGGSAAFSVDIDEREQLIVVAEVESGFLSELRAAQSDDKLKDSTAMQQEVFKAVRRAVSEEHEIQVQAITLLRPDGLLKTSSGKIERHASRTAFLNGTLETWGG